MDISTVQTLKLAIVAFTGLTQDTLHVYIGLGVYIGAAALTGKPLQARLPWFVVLITAVAGEVLDMLDELISLGYWRWPASLHDLVNTLMWPTLIALLARYRVISTGH